ncbi:hypothetical protein CABS03_06583 [Colletotrichum abscissum]|uniref:Uncharacterized protein n=1 Tax=Colletotrichum limetticola TaxID=1209924 RepID=A0ABQ9PA97_9PEZI|nr:hypothetical protein CLIM01_13645 [Colletotrichum limetticola]
MWWINIQSNAPGLPGVILEENTMAYNVLQDIPQVLMAMGTSNKQKFLRKSFPRSIRLSSAGQISLTQYDQFTALLDCTLSSGLSRARGGPAPDCIIRHSLDGLRASPGTVQQTIMSRLFYPFVSTLLLFADDLGGPENTADMLANWATTAHHAPIPPILIIITDSTISQRTFTAIIKSRMISSTQSRALVTPSTPAEAESVLMRHFTKITLVKPTEYAYRPLDTQSHRLTGLHFAHLCKLAILRLIEDMPFDLVAAWRIIYPIPFQMEHNLYQVCAAATDRGINPIGIASSSLASDPLVQRMFNDVSNFFPRVLNQR